MVNFVTNTFLPGLFFDPLPFVCRTIQCHRINYSTQHLYAQPLMRSSVFARLSATSWTETCNVRLADVDALVRGASAPSDPEGTAFR